MKTSTLVFLLAITSIHTAFAAVKGNIADGKTKAGVCAACHAQDGNSADPTFPVLAGQHADYIVKQLEEFKSGARQNAVMAPMAMPLSDQDRAGFRGLFLKPNSQTARCQRCRANRTRSCSVLWWRCQTRDPGLHGLSPTERNWPFTSTIPTVIWTTS